MVKSGYKYITETIQQHDTSYNSVQWNRLVKLRKGPTILRVEHPVNLPRARSVGYKAKQGYVVAIAKIRRGTMRKLRPKMGRKPGNLGVNKITTKKNLRWIAEERTAKHFPNLQVLNSYKIGADGRSHFYEIIMVDPNHPVIQKDSKINWICESQNKSRVYRGLSSAGKKTRGLHKKGFGSERTRPSLRANKNLH